MASIQTTTDMFAAIGAMCAKAPKAVAPISAEQAKATRAALDARQRAGRTVMLRNNKGRFIGSVKVASYGGATVPAHNAPKAAAELPAYALAAE